MSLGELKDLILKKPKFESRLDPEIKGMLNRLLTVLTEYESSVQPIVSEYKKLSTKIKKSQKGLASQQVKDAIVELLNQKGYDTTLDYSKGNFSNLERSISSLIATDPGLWPDLIEKALSQGPEKGAKTIAGAQNKLLKELYSVGHHEQGLKSLRPILEALQGMGNSLREQTLHILERPPYNFDFGELGLRYIIPFAHTEGSLGPGRGPTGIRKDLQPLLDAAFPELGGVKSIDQINKNLRGLIKPLLAHSKAQHGTGGIVPPIDAVKGLTDPRKIAEALRPYLDAQKAGAENAMALSNAIFKHGFEIENGKLKLDKEGNAIIKKAAWLEGGDLEKAIKDIPIINLAPGWETASKANKNVVIATATEATKPLTVDELGDVPFAQQLQFNADGTAALNPDFVTNTKQGVDNAVAKIFNNLEGLDNKTRMWLLQQGPEKIAKGFLSDLGFGTAIGTVFDKKQQQRLMDQEYGAFVSKAIQDELIGQGIWHGGKAAYSALPAAVKPLVATTAKVGVPIVAGALAGQWMEENVAPSTFVSGRGEGRAVDVAGQEEQERRKKEDERTSAMSQLLRHIKQKTSKGKLNVK